MLKLTILLFGFSLPIICSYKSETIFKLTKVHCVSINESLVVINWCYLKPFKRNVSKFYLNVTLVPTFYDMRINMDWRKKDNGYKPFLYNVTVDICAFMRKRNNPLYTLVYNLFKDYSNFNHSCPFQGDQLLDGFYPKLENVLNNLPLPEGEYGLFISWLAYNITLHTTKVYYEFYHK